MLSKAILRGKEHDAPSPSRKEGHTLRLISLFGSIMIALGILNHTGAYGADWKFLRTDLQGEFFYDMENITHPSKNTVGVWLKIVYSERFKKEGDLDRLSQSVGLWEIDCQNKKTCLLSTSHYSEEGEISVPQIWLPPDWKSVTSNTVLDALYKELCK
jgi:hypothetical protein